MSIPDLGNAFPRAGDPVLATVGAVLLCVCLALAPCARADASASVGAIEARVQAIAAQLRCLVCADQNLAASHADLALDLKRQMRTMLQNGASEAEVSDFIVNRYGDFVRHEPPPRHPGWWFWAAPLTLVAVALGGVVACLRRRWAQHREVLEAGKDVGIVGHSHGD